MSTENLLFSDSINSQVTIFGFIIEFVHEIVITHVNCHFTECCLTEFNIYNRINLMYIIFNMYNKICIQTFFFNF